MSSVGEGSVKAASIKGASTASSKPTFQTRTAADIAHELDRRNSIFPTDGGDAQNEGTTGAAVAAPWHSKLIRRISKRDHDDVEAQETTPLLRERRPSGRRASKAGFAATGDMHGANGAGDTPDKKTKPGSLPRPVGGHEKLSTFSGVFVPTCLNVLSILMFLRFGLIIGQAGLVGMMFMLVASYAIDLITIFSLSAIASNGTVRGGGAYYLISRSLGPEFGGSIGLVFYLGLVFNTSLNAVALVDAIQNNFGSVSGNWSNLLPETPILNYVWATVVLVICTGICLAGSAVFARASNGLLVILLVATFSIPVSAIFLTPFEDRKLGVQFTGMSMATFKGNLWPRFTKGAAGSQLKGKETFQSLFGILFPATSGIFAGASMSGDLKNPSRAIPKGTLWALLLTFISYTMVIFAMASTTTRASFVSDLNVIQDTNLSGILVLAGEFATTFFSTLMGVIGAAKLLQALARDELFPGLKIFGQGTKRGDEPVYAIFGTYIIAQLIMLFDINQIASFITMTYLMTFLVMNLATFLLKIGSAPNFRPSFHFFSWQTALAGAIVSGAAMFFVDGLYASACVAILIILFLLVHYTSRPRSWGDVSQSLIYHQVRKYLLRLKPEHVKFWRPQILLFVNDPRRQYKLIQFCNSMKKGSLYILGHVIVSSDFGAAVPEARRQQAAWSKYIDFSKIKAFVNIAVSPGFEWGARNLALSAGLGGMRPNIAVMGFYNMDDMQRQRSMSIQIEDSAQTLTNEDTQPHRKYSVLPTGNGKQKIRSDATLPTDECKTETTTSLISYVTILEDLLLRLQINVAVARNFQNLEITDEKERHNNKKKFIDLWPIQMSAEIVTEGDNKARLLTTNFDTYTLILQLGCILHTVPSWKKSYKLRVCVFVEYESDVEDEKARVQALLENLRIEAKILVFWLANGSLSAYEVIVNGYAEDDTAVVEVEECLQGQEWWEEIQRIRGNRGEPTPGEEVDMEAVLGSSAWPDASFQQGPRHEKVERFLGLRKLLRRSRRSRRASLSVGGVGRLGVQLGMRAQRLPPHLTGVMGSQNDGQVSDSSESEVVDDDDDLESLSAASEGDASDYKSDSEEDIPLESPKKIARRRSHGDTLRGPKPSKKATREKEAEITESKPPTTTTTPARSLRETSEAGSSAKQSGESSKEGSKLHTRESSSVDFSSVDFAHSSSASYAEIAKKDSPLKKLEDRFASLRGMPEPSPPSSSKSGGYGGEGLNKPESGDLKRSPAPVFTALFNDGKKSPNKSGSTSPVKSKKRGGLSAPEDERPVLSRHASSARFSSKPVPVTKVHHEEGLERSIMFIDTPSPPARDRGMGAHGRRNRLPSAYQLDGHSDAGPSARTEKDRWEAGEKEREDREKKSEHKEANLRPRSLSPALSTSGLSRRGSTYSTQALPLSFNDLPCRAQHLILNQLMMRNSKDTAVMFTTLPSPAEGTSKDEARCLQYLGDLEVLGRGGVPVMMVHSNSMTVTMAL